MAARILLMVLIAMFAILSPLFAADITGEWHAEIKRSNTAPMPTAFNFEVEGSSLTGVSLYSSDISD